MLLVKSYCTRRLLRPVACYKWHANRQKAVPIRKTLMLVTRTLWKGKSKLVAKPTLTIRTLWIHAPPNNAVRTPLPRMLSVTKKNKLSIKLKTVPTPARGNKNVRNNFILGTTFGGASPRLGDRPPVGSSTPTLFDNCPHFNRCHLWRHLDRSNHWRLDRAGPCWTNFRRRRLVV